MFNDSEISISGKLGGQDSFESIDSFESCDRLTQSPGVASRRSTAYREFPRTTASTRRTTPLRCTGTSQREPSKTTCGNARTSARTSRSSRQPRSLGTQVSINICLSQPAIWVRCVRLRDIQALRS